MSNSSQLERPSISFVVAARNDDYGGNFLNRISTCIRVLDAFARKHKLRAEVIVVEYNPPQNKKRLYEELKELVPLSFVSVRFIEVPPSFHQKFENSSKNPLFEFIAKNIGVRRAQGEYIAAMNPDIVLSEELVASLAQGELKADAFYRVNRHDIRPMYIDPSLSAKEVEVLCRKTTAKILLNRDVVYVSYISWWSRFIHGRTKRSFFLSPIFNRWTVPPKLAQKDKIHENAAGDFLMMHRSVWNAVGGYDEAPLGSAVLDSYILYVMYCLNFKQVVLPYPIYHIEHHYGKGGRPMATYDTFRKNADDMLRTKIPYKPISHNWGFQDETFKEFFL